MGEELNPLKKWKKRAKRFLCAGIIMLLLGIICFACGIGLLVNFAKYWGDAAEKTKSGVSYFGCAVLILGVLLLAISIGIFVTMCIVYRRIENNMSGAGAAQQYHKKTYAYGEAPYPQQKPSQPTQPLSGGGPDPSAPYNSTPEKQPLPADQGDVQITVTDHHKF